jgi:hypothetical protein
VSVLEGSSALFSIMLHLYIIKLVDFLMARHQLLRSSYLLMRRTYRYLSMCHHKTALRRDRIPCHDHQSERIDLSLSGNVEVEVVAVRSCYAPLFFFFVWMDVFWYANHAPTWYMDCSRHPSAPRAAHLSTHATRAKRMVQVLQRTFIECGKVCSGLLPHVLNSEL